MKEIESLYRTEKKKMINVLIRIGVKYPDAEDVVQDVFVSLLSIPEADHDDLRAVAYDLLWKKLSHHRAKFSRPLSQHPGNEKLSDSPEQVTVNRDMINKVCSTVNSLNNDLHRDILKLIFLFGMTPAHAAKVLDERADNVRKVIQRFRNKVEQDYGAHLHA